MLSWPSQAHIFKTTTMQCVNEPHGGEGQRQNPFTECKSYTNWVLWYQKNTKFKKLDESYFSFIHGPVILLQQLIQLYFTLPSSPIIHKYFNSTWKNICLSLLNGNMLNMCSVNSDAMAIPWGLGQGGIWVAPCNFVKVPQPMGLMKHRLNCIISLTVHFHDPFPWSPWASICTISLQ